MHFLLEIIQRLVATKVFQKHWGVIAAFCGGGLLILGLGAGYGGEAGQKRVEAGQEDFLVSARPISADKIDPDNNGQPVILTGMLSREGGLSDPEFKVDFQDAISVYRLVEVRQYDEQWEGIAQEERYIGLIVVWSEEPISTQKAANPPFLFKSKFFKSSSVRVGAFKIPSDLVGELEPDTHLATGITEITWDPLRMAGWGEWSLNNGFHTLTRPTDSKGVGDHRMAYKALAPCEVTIFGAQQGDTIGPYADIASGETYSIQKGKVDPAKLLAGLQANAGKGSWLYRMGAGCLLACGFFLLGLGPSHRKEGGWIALVLLAPLAAAASFGLVWAAVWKFGVY